MSTGGNRAYRLYSSLKEPDAIRLLRLLPSPSSSNPLQCELYTTTLSAYEDEIIDHFTAISYVWGDADDTRHILVNGFTLRVTANLETALRDLRAETSIRILWIDAICINQQDLTERASQVGLMGKIYSLALHTVIYLGPTDGPPKDALFDLGNVPRDLATQVGTPARSHKVTSKHGDVKSSLVTVSSLSGSQHWQQTAKAERSGVSNNKGTLANILERPWFTRVWVFQELIFSRDPWLQVGSIYRIRWSDFGKLQAIDFGLHLELNPAMLKGCLLLQGMNNARMRHAANYKPPLLELLEGRRGLGVSDPRDMLFAHVDISLEGRSDPRLQVDYRKTIEEVYTGITTYFLEQPSIGYKILSFVGDSSILGGFPGRPSWVPDWTLSDIGLKRIHQDYGNPDPSLVNGRPSFFQDSNIIAARGRSLGRIKAIGKPMIRPPLAFFDRSHEVKINLHLTQQSNSDYHSYINDVNSMRNDHRVTSLFTKMQKHRKNVETAKLGYKRFTEHYKKKLEILFERRARRYMEIYNHWLQELGPDILPPLTESLEAIVESIGFDEVFGSIPPTMRDLEDPTLLSESAIAHLLFAGSNSSNTSIVVNRRLARLDSGLLVFAPPSAKLGDIVCFLEGSSASDEFHPDFHDTPFVLRPEPSRENPEIDANILASDGGKLNRPLIRLHKRYKLENEPWRKPRPLAPSQSLRILYGGDKVSSDEELQNFQGAKIEHFTFVGEAFVDGMMLGRGRSKLYHGDWESMVFAIH